MAEEVKFIEFQEVANAPKIAVPADFSEDEIKPGGITIKNNCVF